MLKVLLIGLTFLIVSCASLNTLKPTDYVYKITEGRPCYYDSLIDLSKNKNMRCVEIETLETWLVIHPDNLKEFLTKGVDELIAIKNQNKPVIK